MTDDRIQLTRRKILASTGAIGLAGAGAGLGTSALFSDRETFGNNSFAAGSLDLVVNARSVYHGAEESLQIGPGGTSDGDPTFNVSATDVKPGDWGLAQFCFDITDNPAYLWTCGDLTENAENGQTEPEADVDESPGGELAEATQAVLFYCPRAGNGDVPEASAFQEDGDYGPDDFHPGDPGTDVAGTLEDAGLPVLRSGSLASVLTAMNNGLALDGTPFEGDGRTEFPAGAGQACLCMLLYLPRSVGNEVQTDSASFDLDFHAIQSRHNDGSQNPCCSCGPNEVAVELSGGSSRCVPVWKGDEGQTVQDFYDFSPWASGNGDIQTEDATNLVIYEEPGGDRYLVVVHDIASSDDQTGGAVDGQFTGASAGWAVKDDDGGNDSFGIGSAEWTWSAPMTDGGAIGPLQDDFDVGIDLDVGGGIDALQYLTGVETDPIEIDGDVQDGTSTHVYTCSTEEPQT